MSRSPSFGDDAIDANPPAIAMVDAFERVNGPVLAVERAQRSDFDNFAGVIAVIPALTWHGVLLAIRCPGEKPLKDEAPQIWQSSGRRHSRPTSSRRSRRQRATARREPARVSVCGSWKSLADLRV